MDAVITVSQPARARQFAREGVTIPPSSRLPIPVADLTPASRALLASWSPALDEIHFVLPPRGRFGGIYPAAAWSAPLLPATPADWELLINTFAVAVAEHAVAARAADQAAIDKALVEADHSPTAVPYLPSPPRGTYTDLFGYAQLTALIAERKAALEARRKVEEIDRRQRAAERQAEQERAAAQRDADKLAWLAEHGSDYLKRAVDAGYDCQRRYTTERAAVEHPDYQVAFDGVAYRSRSCPTEAALAEAERVNGTVIWLTAPLDDDVDTFEACEAVLVEGYLGQYELVRLM